MVKTSLKFFSTVFKSRWFIFFATGFFVSLILCSTAFFTFEFYYKDKIFPGVKIGSIKLSGKSFDEAFREVEKSSNQLIQDGLFFKYKEKEVVVSSLLIAPEDPGLSKEIFSFELEKSINEAYKFGRGKNIFLNIKNRISAFLSNKEIMVYYELNKEELTDVLVSNFYSLEDPGQDAKIDIKIKNNKFKITVLPEKLGKSFDYGLSIKRAENNLKNLSVAPIQMYMKTDYPKIKENDARNKIPLVKKVLSVAPVSLKYECLLDDNLVSFCPSKEEKLVSNQEFINWIVIGDEDEIRFDKEKIKIFLEEEASIINVAPQDAKFKIEDEKVLEFQESKDGVKLSIDKTLLDIEDKFLAQASSTANIIIEKDIAKNSIGAVNDLGIKELLGVGESSFAGSPQNRRHNIKIGASSLDGLLIKADEEFSLVSALGTIDAKAGYLPELVIKGNKTVPEYGGGLCQIATTGFRVALDSGLPITERRPHAYRVSYYEPAGTDATIYIPKPDMKFLNDTGNYILIQTKIEGDNLTFEFWGTSDGREVEITEPKIFNIVSPGPTKIVETEDLEPGEKKCTESSHNGADAEFTRKITNALGEENEETWFSRYRPWQAVCLIGKEPEENTTSTEEIIE
jgi:vancomycin resistance protein YoaR